MLKMKEKTFTLQRGTLDMLASPVEVKLFLSLTENAPLDVCG